MRFYLIIIFIGALFFEFLAYFISKHREKLNSKFIESKHDFLAVICHHLLALLNVIVLVVSFIALSFYVVLLLTVFFSVLANTEIYLNPIVNIPFSVIIISFLVLIFIAFEIIAKRNIRVKEIIDKLCDMNNPNNDEKMGMIGNLRYNIIVYIVPLTTLLFLINFILGVEYA
jgi:hypothetical protein